MQLVKNADMKDGSGEPVDDGMLTTTLLLMGVLVGAVVAVVVLPMWVPGTSAPVAGSDQAVYRHLSRATGFAGFGLVWMSMAFGLIISNKVVRVWPGGPTASDLHQYTSLLGLGFGLVHAMVLLFHRHIHFDMVSVLVPFASADYRPEWVGLGQLGLYGLALLSLTFYLKKQIGQKAWRYIHFGSYVTFVLVLLHSIFSGSDTGLAWTGLIYWFAGASLAVLTVYRVMVARSMKQGRAGA